MQLTDAQVSILKTWMTEKLGNLSEVDTDVMVDYVFAIIHVNPSVGDIQRAALNELPDFLEKHTSLFVDELLLKLSPPPPLRPRTVLPLPARNILSSAWTTRNPLPASQIKNALRNAGPLPHTTYISRKRSLADGDGDNLGHVGNRSVTKRGRSSGVDFSRGRPRNWRGRSNPAASGANMEPLGSGYSENKMSFTRPPKLPPGLPAFFPTNPVAEFSAMFPYRMATATDAHKAMKKELCEYPDEHGYCMRRRLCLDEHSKKTVPSINDGSHSYHFSNPSPTREEPEKPLTTDSPLDIEVFKAEQEVKQRKHKERLATLKKKENEKMMLSRKAANLHARLEAEKAKLVTMPGGHRILEEITADQKRRTLSGLKIGAMELERTASVNVIDPDFMSDHPTRAESSALSNVPDPSPKEKYLGSNPALCKYYPNCTNASCTFLHRNGGPMSEVECRYYLHCTNPGCGFKHPMDHVRPSSFKRLTNRSRSLLVSGVSASINNID